MWMTMDEIETHGIRYLAERLVHYVNSEGVRRRLEDRIRISLSLAEEADEYPKILGDSQTGQGLRKDSPR